MAAWCARWRATPARASRSPATASSTTRARHDRKLTLILGQRSDIPRQYFLKLLESASAAVRAKLEAANPKAARRDPRSVDEVATAMQREARGIAAARPPPRAAPSAASGGSR